MISNNFDFQGHRGCRGLIPENTIAGFLKAIELGVTTLEIDVVITADEVVICSHEPWFSHEISLLPSRQPIAKSDEKNHLIYTMTFAETQNYDVGLKPNLKFPHQLSIPAVKPRLDDVIEQCDASAKHKKRPLPNYNIEIKCEPETDGVLHPFPDRFSELVANVISKTKIENRVIIQSFDVRILRYFHQNYREIPLGLLIENEFSPGRNIEILGFTPSYYNPEYILVNDNLIAFCKSEKMRVVPWTVNELSLMKRLIAMGVDGLISDFPNLFESLY